MMINPDPTTSKLQRILHIGINILFIISLISLWLPKSFTTALSDNSFPKNLPFLLVGILYLSYLYAYSKGWGTVKNVYLFIASTLLSVAVLFFILNVVCSIAKYSIDKAEQYRSNSAKSAGRTLQEVHADLVGLSLRELAILKSETWTNRWEYEPWVGFKERPRTGTYVNVYQEGYRKTKDGPRDARHLIFLFGGSTMFGYNVTDEQTIASYLQGKINALYPYGDFAVRNYGRGYYFSAQEFLLLLQLLYLEARPAIVIFLDGLNEGQVVPWYTNELRIMFQNYQNPDAITISTLATLFNNTPFFSLLRRVLYHGAEERLVKDEQRSAESNMEKVRNNYVLTQNHIRAICKLYNITPYFFLQPVPGYRNNYTTHLFLSAPLYGDIKPKFKSLSDLSHNGLIIDLSGLLSHYDKQPFVDVFHYSPEVNKMIAEEIFARLRATLDRLQTQKED